MGEAVGALELEVSTSWGRNVKKYTVTDLLTKPNDKSTKAIQIFEITTKSKYKKNSNQNEIIA